MAGRYMSDTTSQQLKKRQKTQNYWEELNAEPKIPKKGRKPRLNKRFDSKFPIKEDENLR